MIQEENTRKEIEESIINDMEEDNMSRKLEIIKNGLEYSRQHIIPPNGLLDHVDIVRAYYEGAKWADDTMIEKAISKCARMLLNIDELLRKKGLKGQFEEEFDTEYKKFKKVMEE